MKRPDPAAWLVLAAVMVGLVLLLDPLGWFGGEPRVEPPSLPTTGSEVAAAEPATLSEPEEGIPAARRPEEPGRAALDADLLAERTALRVIDASGRPVPGARVLLARNDAILLDERTDSEGAVELHADAQPCDLVVALANRPAAHWTVSLEPGVRELRLPEGHPVSGRLVGEDGARTAGLALRLGSDHPFPDNGRIPEVVWAALELPSRIRAFLSATTAADGGFVLEGLPWSWSGRLWVPHGWRVLSTSQGTIEPHGRGIRLAQPARGLVVRVARESTLHGRVVLRDGQPLAGASLSAMTRSPETRQPEFTDVEADEEGRFELSRKHERVDTFDLHLGGRFHESPSILRLDGAALPPDGDLGDVVVDAVRNVPFLLLDPDRTPIAGGTAAAGGTRSAGTGRDGRSILRWLPRSVDRMRVEARGFVPAEVELPETLPEPLVVELVPGCRLEVRVVPPEGGDPRQFKVLLLREEGVAAHPIADRAEQHAHVGEWAFPPPDLRQAAPGSFLIARPAAADGVAVFHALKTGVELELAIRGVSGEAVYQRRTLAPFAPGEVRRIDMSFDDGTRVFRGRVLDAEGEPLLRAMIQLGNQILGWTDAEGAFLCFVTEQEPRTLLVQHEACSTLFLHDYVVPADGEPVDLRLSPAHRVTIEVVDEAGRPVPQAEVWIQQEGFTTNTHVIDGHRHAATSLTDNPFEILVRLAGRVYRQEHTSVIPVARVVVPVHGRLVAVVSGSTTSGRTGGFLLHLRPAEGEPALPLTESRASAPDLRIEISAVHPGVYQASLRYMPSEEEHAAGRDVGESGTVTVTVTAGEETMVRLDLPRSE